jgi:hypothetical protein
METLRLLDTGALSAAENMALDETLLEPEARTLEPTMLEFTSP